MAENTFLGLQSYSEADAYRFKGRTEESQELFRLIVRNDYTVCYAESGEGKTSLLNAGVFPLLRQKMYFPIAITFTSDDYERTPDSFDIIIDRCIKDSITYYNEKNQGINIEYKLCSTDFQDTDLKSTLQQELSKYSWWKLRNHKPQAMGLTFTPVFIFDQFEEVFNLPGSIVWTKKFFDWLEDVSADSCPDEIINKVREIIGTNAAFPAIKEEKDFKAVFSLRKEFIGELDYWGMQKCFIPSLKDNRYCLKALTFGGAKKVMTQQQRFEESKVEQVLRYFVQQYSREPDKTIAENLPVISALLLSVVCDSWEKDINYFSDTDAIGIDESLNKILEKFYDEALSVIVNDLSQKANDNQTEVIRKDIETAIFALVDSNGKRVRRKSSELTHLDFDAKYKEILSDKRIIKISKVDGEDYVEIVHDALCPIISKRKELHLAVEAKKREEEKLRNQAKKNRKRMLLMSCIIFVAFAVIGYFYYQNQMIQKSQWQMLETRARSTAEKANQLTENRDFYNAIALCLEVIPNNLHKPEKPYVWQVEAALRKAYYELCNSENAKIAQFCDDNFQQYCTYDWGITPDSQYVYRYSVSDDYLDLYEIESGNLVLDHIYSYNDPLFSPKEKRVIITKKENSDIDDNYFSIIDISSSNIIAKSDNYTKLYPFAYTPNGKYIVATSSENGCTNTLLLFSSEDLSVIAKSGYHTNLHPLAYTPDGKYIVAYSGIDFSRPDSLLIFRTNDLSLVDKKYVRTTSYIFFVNNEQFIIRNRKSKSWLLYDLSKKNFSLEIKMDTTRTVICTNVVDSLLIQLEAYRNSNGDNDFENYYLSPKICYYNIWDGRKIAELDYPSKSICRLNHLHIDISKNLRYITFHDNYYMEVIVYNLSQKTMVKHMSDIKRFNIDDNKITFKKNDSVWSYNFVSRKVESAKLSDLFNNQRFILVPRDYRSDFDLWLLKNHFADKNGFNKDKNEVLRNTLYNDKNVYQFEICDSKPIYFYLDGLNNVHICNYDLKNDFIIYSHGDKVNRRAYIKEESYEVNEVSVNEVQINVIPSSNDCIITTTDSILYYNTDKNQFNYRIKVPHLTSLSTSMIYPYILRTQEYPDDNLVRLYRIANGEYVCTLDSLISGNVIISPTGNYIAAYLKDWSLGVFNAHSGKLIWHSPEIKSNIHGNVISINEQKNLLAAYSNSIRNEIMVLNLHTGEFVSKLFCGSFDIMSVDINEDGKYLAVMHNFNDNYNDFMVDVWDLNCHQIVQSFYYRDVSEHAFPRIRFNNKERRIEIVEDGTVTSYSFMPLEELITKVKHLFHNRKLTPKERQKYYLE